MEIIVILVVIIVVGLLLAIMMVLKHKGDVDITMNIKKTELNIKKRK